MGEATELACEGLEETVPGFWLISKPRWKTIVAENENIMSRARLAAFSRSDLVSAKSSVNSPEVYLGHP